MVPAFERIRKTLLIFGQLPRDPKKGQIPGQSLAIGFHFLGKGNSL